MSLPQPSDEEVHRVLRLDWTVTRLSVAFAWAIVALMSGFGVWIALSSGIDFRDPGILLPTAFVLGVLWAIPVVMTVVTWCRRKPSLPT